MEWYLSGGKRNAMIEDSSLTSESSEDQNESPKTKRRIHKKYSTEYPLLKFTSVGPDEDLLPVCVCYAQRC